MKIFPNIPFADAKDDRRQGEQAFTMVEIAIAIGVIGFALVAVIGILPAGMNVQKDNREDTTISEDAPLFMDAIRNGGAYTNNFGLDYLTNYVEKITIYSNYNGNLTTNYNGTVFSNFDRGTEIIGLLSTPEPYSVTGSNFIFARAIVRSLGGAAVQQNGANVATAFRYQMDVEIVPYANFANIAPDSIAFNNYLPTNSPEYLQRYYRWLEVTPGATPAPEAVNLPVGLGTLAYSLFDVRLKFSWPVLPNGNVGPGRQTYRSLVASELISPPGSVYNGADLWYFQPQLYTNQNTILSTP
jgi:type II secretory pathway pseudopilin PulG